MIEVGNSVMYQLCGLGPKCSIAEGQPSEARARLLRREALELALYTFKYVDDIDTVITLLPPNLGDPSTEEDDTSTALFLEKKDFSRQLQAPLDRTLTGAAAELDPIESQTIERLTRPPLPLRVPAAPGRSAILRLLPVPTGEARPAERSARAKARLDTLASTPSPCASTGTDRGRAVVLPAARAAPLPRLRAVADDPAPRAPTRPTTCLRTSSVTSGRGSIGGCIMLTYATTRYRRNPYELEARRAVELTR